MFLPSFPFHVRWKSPFLVLLWRETPVWVIVDMKVFVPFFLIESFPAFVKKADVSHLSFSGQTWAFFYVYHKDRKMQLRLATPPFNILGSFGPFPNKDAFPWSQRSLVTFASTLCQTNFERCVDQAAGTVWGIERVFRWRVLFRYYECLYSDLILKHLNIQLQWAIKICPDTKL